ncbi:MAG: ATP synthase F1 subunit delta [Christensenellales bacterium]
MIINKVSAEYAGALFELSVEKGVQKQYYDDVVRIYQALKENPAFGELLTSANVTIAEKIDIVDKAFGSLNEDVVSWVKILCEKKRFDLFDFCYRDYVGMYNDANKILTAKVRTALPLSKEEKQRLTKELEKKSGHKVVLECVVDANVLGGMIIEHEGKIIDGSLKTRLNRIKEVINK